MSKWMLRALLATSVASLALNAAIAWRLFLRAPVPVERPRGAGFAGVVGAAPAPAPATTPAARPFTNTWEYVDRKTGQRARVVFRDDTPRLAQFIREAHLTPEQTDALRRRFDERRAVETGLAERMVGEGRWDPAPIMQLQQKFWTDEFARLPPAQTRGMSAEFFPPTPSAPAP